MSIVSEFAQTLRAGFVTLNDCTDSTIIKYTYWLERYFKVFPAFDIDGIRSFIIDLEGRESSRNQAVYAFKTFALFLNDENLAKEIARLSIKRRKRVRRDKTERSLALRLIKKYLSDDCYTEHRKGIVLALLLYTGVRIHELAKLRWDDFNWERNRLTILGKGKKTRCVPLGSSLVEALTRYRDLSGHSPYLFPKVYNLDEHLNVRSLQSLLQHIGKENDCTIRAHDMRRTFITDLILKGYPIALIAKISGHASITTTQIYEQAEPEEVADVTQNWNFE